MMTARNAWKELTRILAAAGRTPRLVSWPRLSPSTRRALRLKQGPLGPQSGCRPIDQTAGRACFGLAPCPDAPVAGWRPRLF